MKMCRQDLLGLLACSILLASCTRAPSVRQGAVENGKIEATTAADPNPHKIDTTVAILPFNNNSDDASLDKMGTTLADMISAQMAASKGFKLVERQRLDAIMKEQKLGMTGAVDTATAVQIGKIAGANVIAFGSF